MSGTDRTVVDAGSNLGWFALLSAKLGCAVQAFEPQHLLISLAQRSAVLNSFGSIQFHHAALSAANDEEVCLIWRERGNLGNTDVSIKANSTNAECKSSAKTVTLDSAVLDRGSGCPFLLKVDVERSWWTVLQGASRILACDDLKHIVLEMDQGLGTPARAAGIEKLEKLGFRAYGLPKTATEFGDDACLPVLEPILSTGFRSAGLPGHKGDVLFTKMARDEVDFVAEQLRQRRCHSQFMLESSGHEVTSDVRDRSDVAFEHNRGYLFDCMRRQGLYDKYTISWCGNPLYHWHHQSAQMAVSTWLYFLSWPGPMAKHSSRAHLNQLEVWTYGLVKDLEQWIEKGRRPEGRSDLQRVASAENAPVLNCEPGRVTTINMTTWVYMLFPGVPVHFQRFTVCEGQNMMVQAALFCWKHSCTMDAWENLLQLIENMANDQLEDQDQQFQDRSYALSLLRTKEIESVANVSTQLAIDEWFPFVQVSTHYGFEMFLIHPSQDAVISRHIAAYGVWEVCNVAS